MSNYKENTMVSVAKGIGILLVLIGHFCLIPWIKRFIYLFHMPLFFFLSGYLFTDKDIKEFPRYIFKKIKSLYLPFVACNMFAMLFHNFFCSIGVYNPDELFSKTSEVIKYIVKVLLCIKMEDIVAPMWFLPILLAVSVLYFLLRSVTRNNFITSIVVVVIFCLSYLFVLMDLKEGISRAFILVGIGMWSFHLGNIYKQYETNIMKVSSRPIFVICCIVIEVVLSLFVDINMIQMRFSNPLFYTIGELLGINVILWISYRIKNNKVLRFFGNNSLMILKWHYWGAVIVTFLQSFIYVCAINGIIMYSRHSILWFLVYLIGGLGVPIILVMVKEKIRIIFLHLSKKKE